MLEVDDRADGRWILHAPDQLDRLWPGARFSSLGLRPFRSVVLRRTLARSRIEGIGATPYRCDRTPDMVKEHPRDGFAIAVVIAGRVSLTQGGQSFHAVEGDVFIHRTGAFSFECPETGRTFRTIVGAGLVPGGDQLDFQPFGIVPPTALSASYSRFAYELLRGTADTPLFARTANQLEHALLTLQRALLGDALDRQTEQLSADDRLLLRALDHIEKNLADPGLAPESIARELGVSRRRLFYAFERQAESIAATVRRRRIEAATQMLENTPSITVGDLAASHGFASVDNFGRAFRRHHGASVSEYRFQRAVDLLAAARRG